MVILKFGNTCKQSVGQNIASTSKKEWLKSNFEIIQKNILELLPMGLSLYGNWYIE